MKYNINEIKNQYPALRNWADSQALELYKRIQEHQLITEFLHTIDPMFVAKQLDHEFGDDISITPFGENNKVTGLGIQVIVKLGDIIKKLDPFLDKYGYFPSVIVNHDVDIEGKYSITVDKLLDTTDCWIKYEAKYDTTVVPNSKYVYHITPDIMWPKIKSLGLTPKTQGKLGNHPGRIYLLADLPEPVPTEDVSDIAYQLLNTYKNKNMVNFMYVLRIDISKLNDPVFFKDPNFFMGTGIWTYKNIPPNSITIEDKFPVV